MTEKKTLMALGGIRCVLLDAMHLFGRSNDSRPLFGGIRGKAMTDTPDELRRSHVFAQFVGREDVVLVAGGSIRTKCISCSPKQFGVFVQADVHPFVA
jgi:hypothetical protein